MGECEKFNNKLKNLSCKIQALSSIIPSATRWTPNHNVLTGNKYIKDTLVWYNNDVYKCKVDNNNSSITNPYFWEKIGRGLLLDEEQTDWNSTGGASFLRNKPTRLSQFINDIYSPTGDSVIPNLDQVTSVGNSTNNIINVGGLYVGGNGFFSDGYTWGSHNEGFDFDYYPYVGFVQQDGSTNSLFNSNYLGLFSNDSLYGVQLDANAASISGQNNSLFGGIISFNPSLTDNRNYLLPDKSGTFAMLSDLTGITAGYALESWVTLNFYPSTSNPAGYLTSISDLQAVTNVGANTTNNIKIGTGSSYTGIYHLLKNDGFDIWFNGGYNISDSITYQIKRESLLNSNKFQQIDINNNVFSISSRENNDSSQINAYASELVLTSGKVDASASTELRILKDKIQLSKLVGGINKTINLLLDNTTIGNNYYFPVNAGTLALVSDITSLSSTYLALSGGTMSGDLQVLTNPLSSNSAISKNYFDNVITGLTWKIAAKCSTTANHSLSGTLNIDDVTIPAGTRVLVRFQSTASENGIYITSTGVWTRALDCDTASEIEGSTVLVSFGTLYKNTQWTQSNIITTIGIDPVNYVQISGAGTYTNGLGLDLTSNVFSISSLGVTNSMINDVDWSKITNVPTTIAGYGITDLDIYYTRHLTGSNGLDINYSDLLLPIISLNDLSCSSVYTTGNIKSDLDVRGATITIASNGGDKKITIDSFNVTGVDYVHHLQDLPDATFMYLENITTNVADGNPMPATSNSIFHAIEDAIAGLNIIIDTTVIDGSTNAVDGNAVFDELSLKQDVLVSGINIKTVNGNSLIGGGNIVVGDALTSVGLSQFASTSSSQLAGIISDETGTGALVFNNNPTFITGINITGGDSAKYLLGNGAQSSITFNAAAISSLIILSTTPNVAIVTGDSINNAFMKTQGQLNAKQATLYRGTYSVSATAQSTFTITIGVTMANTTYIVPQPGARNMLSAVNYFINNKTTTTFDVVSLTGLTGVVSFDWLVIP